jgi:hypothetical protein
MVGVETPTAARGVSDTMAEPSGSSIYLASAEAHTGKSTILIDRVAAAAVRFEALPAGWVVGSGITCRARS